MKECTFKPKIKPLAVSRPTSENQIAAPSCLSQMQKALQEEITDISVSKKEDQKIVLH
jgi:hypothetical protein